MSGPVTPHGRCAWVPDNDPLYLDYHDTEWGVPERDSRALFEKLVLDGFQAGLSWRTILHKREAFRRAFKGFDPDTVAAFGEKDVARLLADAGIVRHRGKIEGAVGNARHWCAMRDAGEDFATYCWSFFGDAAIQNAWETHSAVPATSPQGDALSKDLKARGFSFCGPTIVYAFAQATGMVNDHLTTCPRRAPCAALA